MASEERYLWVLHYEFHGKQHLWWTYFKDEQEARTCIAEIVSTFPCVQEQSLEEYEQGLLVLPYYYFHLDCFQERTDAAHKEMERKRDEQLFPLAPFACD